MPSSVMKHSIAIAGHKTGVSLEDCFWKGQKEIARHRDLSLSNLVSTVEAERAEWNAVRDTPLDVCDVIGDATAQSQSA